MGYEARYQPSKYYDKNRNIHVLTLNFQKFFKRNEYQNFHSQSGKNISTRKIQSG